MKETCEYMLSGGVKCVIPFDTYLYVQIICNVLRGNFIAKIDKDFLSSRGVLPKRIAFYVYAMDTSLKKICVGIPDRKVHSFVLRINEVLTCREFSDTEIPLIISWWMTDEFKQEIFGL
jgi:hypothetical protein